MFSPAALGCGGADVGWGESRNDQGCGFVKTALCKREAKGAEGLAGSD